VVEIKSTIENSTLTLDVLPETRTGWTFRARLSGPHVSGVVDVNDLSKAELPTFFRELADRSWSGWEGTKTYRSLEGDLKLDATRDRLGHVLLRVELFELLGLTDWMAGGTLQLDSGQLPELSLQVDALLGIRRDG
jgi:hypothetical protein